MSASSSKVVIAAMAGNGLIAISKFVAFFFTGSASVLAEAVHSVADTTNQVLLLVGMRRAARRPTALHPLGFAAESYFWPFMVSVMIFVLGGAFALYEGVEGLLTLGEPAPHHEGGHLADYIVLGVATVIEAYSWSVAMREFRKVKGSESTLSVITKSKDPTIPVVLLEDTAALLGLLIALGAVGLTDATGWAGWDAVGSLAIGLLLFSVSYLLSRETYSLLLGETASIEDRQRIVEIVERDAEVSRVTQLIAIHRGADDVLLALKVAFASELSLSAVELGIDRIETALRTEIPKLRHIFVEPDSDYDPNLDADRPDGIVAPPRLE